MENLDVAVLRALRDWLGRTPGTARHGGEDLGFVAAARRLDHGAARRRHGGRLGVRVNDMPDDAVRAFRPDRRSGVVALTHDPKLDDLALLEALESDTFYVDAIGSKTPPEIAISAMAEILALKNGKDLSA
jgi:xanthine/CO dehydrogenase XdhC/CoxF family maturation factor